MLCYAMSMETCTVCFASVATAVLQDHLRFHKKHDHHLLYCARTYFTGDGNPPNPCNCPMLSVWV